MKYTFIYPSDYFDSKIVDEVYADEMKALVNADFKAIVYHPEKKKSLLIEGDTCIYRGWMLSDEEYDALEAFVNASGAKMLTSKDKYFNAHYMPNWYETLINFTPKTLVIEKNKLNEIEAIAESTGWSDFFVKDYVKSLTTKQGSIAHGIAEVLDIVSKIETLRTIEGGICLREVKSFVESSEIRYFVLNGHVYAPNKLKVPEIAIEISDLVDLPFYSIDIIRDNSGKEWLVEIGDGQVSSYKSPWSSEDIVQIFQS
jgi:hypothetical protein